MDKETRLKLANVLVYAPTDPVDVGLAGGLSVGVPYLVSRIYGSPNPLRRSLAYSFGAPSVVGGTMMDVGRILLNPLTDPKYTKGQQGYLKSVGEGFNRGMDYLDAAGVETRNRYGVAGIPIQALHGILNPVTGLSSLARAASRKLSGEY